MTLSTCQVYLASGSRKTQEKPKLFLEIYEAEKGDCLFPKFNTSFGLYPPKDQIRKTETILIF